MITTFYGTQISKNLAPQLLSACAFETAFSLSRKTLVLQFEQRYPVETLLLGSQTTVKEIDTGISDDTGIETLIRKTRSKGLKEEHFTTYCKQIISSKSQNNFDVATVAKLADFKKDVVNDLEIIRELLETASRIYNTIYILADGKDEKLIEMLTSLSEKNIVCIEQGNKQEAYCCNEKTVYLIPNYDEESLYTLKYLKKLYNTNQMFYLPYNVGFNDACKKNDILRYLYENNDKSDSVSGKFVKRLKEITALITGSSVKEMDTGLVEWNFKNILPTVTETVSKREMLPHEIDIRTEKKHFFSRKKTTIHFNKEETPSKEDINEEVLTDTQRDKEAKEPVDKPKKKPLFQKAKNTEEAFENFVEFVESVESVDPEEDTLEVPKEEPQKVKEDVLVRVPLSTSKTTKKTTSTKKADPKTEEVGEAEDTTPKPVKKTATKKAEPKIVETETKEPKTSKVKKTVAKTTKVVEETSVEKVDETDVPKKTTVKKTATKEVDEKETPKKTTTKKVDEKETPKKTTTEEVTEAETPKKVHAKKVAETDAPKKTTAKKTTSGATKTTQKKTATKE